MSSLDGRFALRFSRDTHVAAIIPQAWRLGLPATAIYVRYVTSATVHAARLAGWFLLLACVALILGATLGQSQSGLHSSNLRPGHSIWLELHDVDARIGLVNVLGNVALFAPLGFLLVTALGDSIRRAMIGGALLSATIECLQYRIGRAADIDDVLLNASGALLGAAFAAFVVWSWGLLSRLSVWFGLRG